MRDRPRLTLELVCAALLALCCVLSAVLAVLEPASLLVLVPALVLIAVALILGGRHIRRAVCRAVSCTKFEGSELQLSLESLHLPAALLSGKTMVWYNDAFRQRLLAGEDAFLQPVSRAMAFIAMEPPSSFETEAIRNEISKVFRSLRPLSPDDIAHNLSLIHI